MCLWNREGLPNEYIFLDLVKLVADLKKRGLPNKFLFFDSVKLVAGLKQRGLIKSGHIP